MMQAQLSDYVNWKSLPFWLIHLSCICVFFIPFRWEGPVLALSLYYIRMFFITGGYHRYFAHRAYSTSRVFQFVIAFMAMTSTQKGMIWWAAHHRNHHRYSDTDRDLHSPRQGFWWSHMGWILSTRNDETEVAVIRDFMRFPELVWLNRNFWLPPLVLAVALGSLFGFWGLVWGFSVSTTFLWHGTFTINSLSHLWGGRRYATTDTSRNNFILSLVTLGEGWHNNHHQYPGCARNGFFWWEVDITYYVLKVLSWLGLIWNLHPVPKLAYQTANGGEVPGNGTAAVNGVLSALEKGNIPALDRS